MFRLTFRTVAPLLLFALLFGFAGAVQAQEVNNELKGKDLRWLEEEVAPIITAEEINIYRAIDWHNGERSKPTPISPFVALVAPT